ncbi:MAG TPA: hypothetical protein VNJ02_02620 [Vicinamibacterales bacterium]|nr:hypothetical protein [Vicinamibacterales bacterium]
MLWEILSDGSLPARRDLAWLAFKRIPALTPDAVFRAPAKALLDAVGLTGPYREEKIDRIRATVGEFKRHRVVLDAPALRAAGLLRALRTLRRLAHLDNQMRQRALLFSAEFAVLPVDDDMARVATRLSGETSEGYVVPAAMNKREAARTRRLAKRWLRAQLAADLETYQDAVIYVRHHAQHTCIAIGPHCGVCPLREACAFAGSRRS